MANLPRDHDRKRKGAAPPAPPAADALGYSSQLQALLQGFTQTRQDIMANSGDLKQQAAITMADVERQGNLALAQAENSANTRGALGGSEDVLQRIEVQAQTDAALADAANALNQGLAANRNALATAQRDYGTGSAAVDAAMNGYGGGLLSAPSGGSGGGKGGSKPGSAESAFNSLSAADQSMVKAFAHLSPRDYTPEMGRAVTNFIKADPKGAEEYFTGIWGTAVPPEILKLVKDEKLKRIQRALGGYY
jgi:hypothetical protein